MRAVKGSLGHSHKDKVERIERAALNARSEGLIRAVIGNVHEQAWKNNIGSLAVALPAERRVSARRGWAGENIDHFENPLGFAT